MTVTIDSTGLQIQTLSDIQEEIIVAIGAALSLTATQVERMRQSVKSSLGQLARVESEREAAIHQAFLEVYNTLSLEAEGVPLDRIAALLGVTRRAQSKSEVDVTLTGTASTVIPIGYRVQYDDTGSVWVTKAEYTIGGAGTVAGTLVAEDYGAIAIAAGDWTILDTVVGWTGVTTVGQTITGAQTETDAELRERLAIEAYRRGQGPQAAIRAAVTAITGVTYVGVWESQAILATGTDSDGIPARSINVVVEGGDADDVAQAIADSRPGGIQLYGAAGGTLVTKVLELSNGSNLTVNFNRVDSIDIWIDYTITTSTSEETAPPGVIATVNALLLEKAPELFDIGDDVLPWKLEAAVHEEGIPGIDDVQVTLSYDDGGTDPYTRAKRAISLRERSAFDAARISGTEA